jgi:tRNA/tmRNA/rRNA uracil-C5-methylase (TrmA/RlmC/RlmD family)
MAIVSSPQWEYRIRAQLKVDVAKGCMGFFRRKTNDVIAIDDCPLLDPRINVLLKNQKEIISALPKNTKQLKVIAGTDNSITSRPLVEEFTQSEAVINVGKFEFVVTGNSFFQGNRFLLEKLGTWAKPSVSGEFFVDLFGGLGFFSIMLGKNFSGGLLVESLDKQVELAQRNFINNEIDHITAKAISAETFFEKESNKIPKPDLIIVDPPRPGLTRKVREGIRDLRPQKVLYVSCNPSTQARDVEFFVNKCGYAIERGALFDLYPQTHHLEVVLLLTNVNKSK